MVAAQVRELAQRCSVSARDIRHTMEDSSQSVADAGALVAQSGAALAAIVDNAQQVADKVAAMAMAGREQRAGIEQVNRAVADMDEMTQQNALMVQRVASTSLAMRRNAEALLYQVDFFHVGNNDADGMEPDSINHALPWSSADLLRT